MYNSEQSFCISKYIVACAIHHLFDEEMFAQRVDAGQVAIVVVTRLLRLPERPVRRAKMTLKQSH